MNGLGSNTCIQDAFNLAWKVAYVHRGLAPPSLLESYSTERQPVGRSIVTRANQAFRDHWKVWEALGVLPRHVVSRKEVMDELRSATSKGTIRRRAFQKAISHTSHEYHGLGIELNQRYEGVAIYSVDEQLPYTHSGSAAADPVLHYVPSTYPGRRLPHAWLNKAKPCEPVSTIDLAGHGRFTLFTGIGGDAWKRAASKVSSKLHIRLSTYSIGFRQDWEDVYFDWESLRGVEESGAILVRPDRFIAWRAPQVLHSAQLCEAKLTRVVSAILGIEGWEPKI